MNRYLVLTFITLFAGAAQAQTPARDTSFSKIRLGGYGEMLFQQMNYGANRYLDPIHGAPTDKRAYISLPRAVFAVDYKFRDDLVLGTEIEFEYGGTGAAMELEYEEAGEYETEIEKGGEVVLEQFHITKSFGSAFNLRVGHFIVPVGITNARHEPIFYFGTVRPEGETSLLPCTWHETGIALLGKIKSIGFGYELMLVNGLDPNGFSKAEWIKYGRQSIFEQSVMTRPAYAGRIEYTAIGNLRISASGYLNPNSARNASKPEKMTGVEGNVSVVSVDAQYTGKNIIARANFVYGNLTDSKRISALNRTISKSSGFPRTDVARNAMTYAVEAGYNVLAPLGKTDSRLFPFARYEYCNTQQGVEQGVTADPRYRRSILTIGLNWFVLPNLVVKADYAMRNIHYADFRNEHTMGISIGYMAWFYKK